MIWLCVRRIQEKKLTATKSTRTPCSSETQSDCSPLSCLFRSNRERMGSPSEGWPEFVACVFVLHQVFTQNTSAPLRMRSTHPSNLLCRQRHSVPQNNIPPKVTLWPHRGSCCQPCLTKEQHQCPAKDFVFSLKQHGLCPCPDSGCPFKGQSQPEMTYSRGLDTTKIKWHPEYETVHVILHVFTISF